MKKRVVHLSKYYKPFKGGLEEVVACIAEGTLDREPVVLAFSCDRKTSEEVLDGVKVLKFGTLFNVGAAPFSIRYIFAIIRYMRTNSIIHAHLPNPIAVLGVFLGFYLSSQKCTVIVHWHSDIIRQKLLLKFFKPFQHWILNRATRVIVTSPNYLEGSLPLKPFEFKCRVVPIGIHSLESLVNQELCKALQVRYNGKLIVFALGRHTYYKDFATLISASAKLEEVVVLIGGAGHETAKYIELITNLDLKDRVCLLGRVSDEDLPSYFAAADVFCLPSCEKSEAFGVVQLEAMSVGTCVVSANIKGSGVPWVNKNAYTGLLFEPKNIDELAEKLRYLSNNPTLLRSFGDNAKRRFEEHFTDTLMVTAVEQLYVAVDE